VRLRSFAFVAVVAGLVVYALTRVQVTADFGAFLPSGATPVQRVLVHELRDGAVGRLVLIELSGAPAQRLAEVSRTLRDRLATDPAFAYAANGDASQSARDFAFIVAHRYALSPGVTSERWTVAGLHRALEEQLDALYSLAAPLVQQTLARDPTGEALAIARSLVPRDAPRSVNGVWFDREGRDALLLAATRAPASDLAAQARAADALRAAHEAADPSHATRLAFSSPGMLAVATREIIAREAALLTIVSVTLILAVLVFAYRRALPVVLCAVPAAAGLLAGVCAVYAGLGHLNAITLAFGATLLGEAVDYPSFLFTQIAHDETPRAARARLARVLALAVLTTACGAVALIASGVSGLLELGVLTLAGILAAGLVTWFVVADWAPRDLGRTLPTLRVNVPELRISPARRVVALAVLAGVVLAVDVARSGPAFDDDPAHLSPLPASLAERDRAMRSALHAPDVRALVLVRGNDDEAVLRRAEALRPALVAAVAAKEVGGFELVSDVLPSRATQAKRRLALPDPATLQTRLAEAVAGTPFRLDAFAPFIADVAAARTAAPLTPDTLAGTALGVRASALLGHDADGAYAVVPLRDVMNERALAQRVAALDVPGVSWLDLRTESEAMLRTYRHRILLAVAAGIVLIALVLAVGIRSTGRALRIVAPVLAGVLLAAGILVAAGASITIFHLVGMLLVVGIGVNYALFAERARVAPQEFARMLRTLAVTSGTTLCAFVTLAMSSIPVLHALGTTVVTGVVACLALIAWLELPTRREARA
jgi:predicted exporter